MNRTKDWKLILGVFNSYCSLDLQTDDIKPERSQPQQVLELVDIFTWLGLISCDSIPPFPIIRSPNYRHRDGNITRPDQLEGLQRRSVSRPRECFLIYVSNSVLSNWYLSAKFGQKGLLRLKIKFLTRSVNWSTHLRVCGFTNDWLDDGLIICWNWVLDIW